MKQTSKVIIQLSDLTGTRQLIIRICWLISLLPGLIFILFNLLTDIEGPNPFLLVPIFMVGGPILIVGILTYLIIDKNLKRKLIFGVILILFQILILPICWGINDIKLRIFLFNNQTELEMIANNVLDKKWTWEYATTYTASQNLPIRLTGHIEEDKTVLFFISGMIDNCHGIAFSRSGNEATRNNCGQLINWKQLKGKWYEWGTT